MIQFRYTAMNNQGKVLSGALEAGSEAEAIAHIRTLGHLPIGVQPRGAGKGLFAGRFKFSRKPSLRLILLMTQELEALLRAGLELDRALRMLVNFEELAPLSKPLEKVLADVRDGRAFSEGLAAAGIFPPLYVSMVRAGEMGGNLAPTLGRVADYLGRVSALRETLVSALVYPVMLLITAGLSITVILVFVLPQFEPLFAEAGKKLPLSARIVMGLGGAMTDFWWVGAVLIAGAVYLYRRLMREAKYRLMRDRWLLRAPLVGKLVLNTQIERFARTFGTLLSNSVSVPVALAITRDTLSNAVIANAVGETAAKLKEGRDLPDRLRQAGVFPAIVLDLARVGQETGQLDAMMLKLADLFDRETRHAIERLLALLVPCLTIFMGIVVAGLIGTILMAILSVNDLAM